MKQHRRRHTKRHQKRRTQRKQQKGGAWGFTGPAFTPATGMAPIEARTSYGDSCMFPVRPAPQVGGGCGACGLGQLGGGSGTGGYGFDLTNNSMNGVYAALTKGSCPPPQRGGSPANMFGASQQHGGSESVALSSYPAGYGLVKPATVGGTHYMDYVPYGRHCMGGGRRRTHKKAGRRHRRR